MSEISPEGGARPLPKVSVVVPTRDRPELLRTCLEALSRQTLPAEQYEVVVVDDGPSDDTARTVAELLPGIDAPVTYRAAGPGQGPAAARNIGWREAAAPIIGFTDDDTIPDERWLEAGLSAFGADVAGVSGRLVMPLPEQPTDYELNAAKLAEKDFVTANSFFTRDALERIGGFDERFKEAWREDTDVWFSMLDHGMKMVHAPDAVVEHPIRPAPWGVSLSQQKKAEYNPLLYKKHPRLYRERIGHSPRWYYPAAVTGVGAIGALLFGRRRTAGVLAFAWAAMTGAFFVSRLRGTSKRPAHVAEMAVTSALIPPISLYRRIKGSIRFKTVFW